MDIRIRLHVLKIFVLREAAKKFVFVARPLKGGGGAAIKKENFFEALKKIPQKNVATKLERGGGRSGLFGQDTRKITFFAASLNN